jgi:phage baseplate assembly protein W
MKRPGEILGRGLSFPPRVGPDGRLAWSEGSDNIREAIQVILKTDLRERIMLHEFGGGLSRFLFEPNTVTTRAQLQHRIARALELWEPRVAVEAVTVEVDPTDPRAAIATISYRLVATQAPDRVSVAVTLGG